MKFKVKSSSNIVAFPNLDGKKVYDKERISTHLNLIVQNIHVDSNLSDWTILFNILFVKGDSINIYKKGITYPNDKEKEITIQIPIPTNECIDWGIEKSRFAVRPPIDESKFIIIPVDFTKYDNILDYVENSILIGLKTILQKGFSLKGYKIKVE
jgi:hypothetical protein